MDYYDEGLKKILRDIKFNPKGQLISNWFFGVVDFLQKTNKNKSHSSKVEFFRSFFEGKSMTPKASEINWPLVS